MPPLDIDTAGVAHAPGLAGRLDGGVCQVSARHGERITAHGVELPLATGVATAMDFQPTIGGRAAITVDVVTSASEVNRVIRGRSARTA